MAPFKIGIIGGTGLDSLDILKNRQEKFVETPFGKPSDALVLGKIDGVDCVLLARHGRKHTIMPSNVNYRANIRALHDEGCTHVLASTACGSLKEDIRPGDLVIVDQFIDRTTKRKQSFYDGEGGSPQGVCHIPMADPFCNQMRQVMIAAAKELSLRFHDCGTVVTIEGPRFSSRAESKLYRSWGCDLVNMTLIPEVVLAMELGLCYCSVAMATDYDCWKTDEGPVNVEHVMTTLKDNSIKTTKLIRQVVPCLAAMEWDHCRQSMQALTKTAVMHPDD
uniref:S-methyl-5'-thioadenosine phosphorylase isoform X2 n=1 Tax=Myxine glutinosa TaxID=7769 RepID=UPI00358F2CFE